MATMSEQSRGIPATWIEALRAIRADGHNVMGRRGGVLPQVYRALERRGLVVQSGVRSTVTPAGDALLGAPATWSVTFRNHLHDPRDPSDEPAYFRRESPGASREEAHAAGVAWAEDCGDCEAAAVEEVEGPLSAPGQAVPQ